MAVGILAVQGAFREHGDCLDKLGAEYRFIRNRSDIDDSIDRLILPGGESTVQRKLLNELDLFEPLKKLIESDVPVMGTCAGLILLAQTITNGDESVFGTLPVEVCRNAYGRQLGSFSASVEIIIAAVVLFTIFGEQTHCVIIALHARSSHTIAAYGNFVSIRAALISDRNCKHYRHRGRNIFADF